MPHVVDIADIQVGLMEMVTDQIIRNGLGSCRDCDCDAYQPQEPGHNPCVCGHSYETHRGS